MTDTDLDGGIDLDEAAHYGRVDHSDALADVEASAFQWDTARRVVLDVDPAVVEQVCVVGMGGSAIVGHVLQALVADTLQVPFTVHSGYGLPAFAGPSTLVVAVSHSGNTEETLDAVDQAAARGARVAVVTSGGRLAERAEREGWPLARIVDEAPPRHSVGWLLVPLLPAFGLDDQLDDAIAAQRRVVAEAGRHLPRLDNPAKRTADRLAAVDLCVAWGTQGLGGVAARRLATQLNENAKLPAYAATLPEADHNAIVGHALTPVAARSGLVLLRDHAGEHERVAKRVAPTADVVAGHFAWIAEIGSDTGAPLARLAELLVRVDLVSVYTALARGVDPTPIAAIDRLKAELA